CVVVVLQRRLSRIIVIALVAAIAVAASLLIVWPSDWAAGWRNPGPSWGATRSAREAYEGRYSLYVARTTKAQPTGLIQLLSEPQLRMLRGRSVTLDTMVRSGTAAITFGHVKLTDGGAYMTSNSFAARSSWQHLRLTYVVPTDTQSLVIQLSADSPGELFFD